MKEITLEQLSSYSPYGLKIIHGLIRKQITAISLESPFVFCTTYLGSRQKQMVNFKEVKPILRPLTDLTKEIEVNGERFVPIVKLLEINNPKWFAEKNGSRYENIEHNTEGYPRAWVKFQATISIMINTSDILNERHIIIQKLLSWHFDIFGLIEQGLAIDINTLNSEKV